MEIDVLVVYAYEKGLGYRRVRETEALELGRGYWILLKEGKEYTLTGQPLYYYTLSVNEDGWEMIGGCTYEAQASADSCHIDVIFGNDQEDGYQQVIGSEDPDSGEDSDPMGYTESGEYLENGEDLEPGKGYWILLNGIVDQCQLRVEAN